MTTISVRITKDYDDVRDLLDSLPRGEVNRYILDCIRAQGGHNKAHARLRLALTQTIAELTSDKVYQSE